MKYKINITFDDKNSLNDIFTNVLLKEIKKLLKNNKNGVSLTCIDCSLDKGGMNNREHK